MLVGSVGVCLIESFRAPRLFVVGLGLLVCRSGSGGEKEEGRGREGGVVILFFGPNGLVED